MFTLNPFQTKNGNATSSIEDDVVLPMGHDNNNHATEPDKQSPRMCNSSVPSSPSGSDDDIEPSLPDDAPRIPEDAQFADDDYVAPSIVSLQAVIQRLIYNFACNSDVHYRNLLVALGLGSLKGTCAQSNWNIFPRMRKDDINDICQDIPPLPS
ncbi:hypothetical protein K439DRAFT_332807 [Ramaria rubella]|nr:hypothetical protein K439DRAFT_332807 [Ramaria rubella]